MSTELYDREIAHHIGLQRYSDRTVREILALLSDTEKDLLKQLMKLRTEGKELSARSQHLSKVLASIKEVMDEGYAKLNGTLTDEMTDLAEHEVAFQVRSVQAVGSFGLMTKPTREMLKAAVETKPFEGRVLKEWGKDLSDAAFKRVRDQIRMGFVEGESTENIAKRLRGTRAANYKDGVLNMSRNGAEGLVRTAINHTANAAKGEFYKKNKKIIRALRWTSVLDRRTTVICASRDGKEYPVDSGPRPPAHWRCRSTMTALLFDIPDPPVETYQQWLSRQDEDVQAEVLGKTKAELFRKGGMDLDRFVNQSGNEYTLEQLKRRDARAFKRAGITA